MTTHERIHSEVREHYADAARAAGAGTSACCGPDESTWVGTGNYDELADLPDAAGLASLGCGNPTAVADLQEGDVVLDLGSGGGIDVLLSARRVGSTGFAYGLDFTPEMLELARRNAAEAGATNVEFLDGHIEAIPLPDASVDVVISNCVINLSPDKPAVFAEMYRVLRAGGRIGISDVVTEDRLTRRRAARARLVRRLHRRRTARRRVHERPAGCRVRRRVDHLHEPSRRRRPQRDRARARSPLSEFTLMSAPV